jgi:hypothetical protein
MALFTPNIYMVSHDSRLDFIQNREFDQFSCLGKSNIGLWPNLAYIPDNLGNRWTLFRLMLHIQARIRCFFAGLAWHIAWRAGQDDRKYFIFCLA